MVVRYGTEKCARSISLLVKDCFKKPTSGATAVKGKSNGNGRRNSGNWIQWPSEGQCSRRETCGMKHDPDNKGGSNGKGNGSRPSTSPRTNSLGKGTPNSQRSSLSRSASVRKEMRVGVRLSVLFIKRKVANLGTSVRCEASPKHWISFKQGKKSLRVSQQRG